MQSCEKESKKQERNQEVLSRLKIIQSWRIYLQSNYTAFYSQMLLMIIMVIRAEL